MSLNTLKETYKACCQSYADLMIKLMGQTWTNSYWVANIYGGTLDIAGEYYFEMSDIVYAIDNEMTYEEVTAWHDYNVDAHAVNLYNMSIVSWHNGEPRVSRDDIDLLLEIKSEVVDALTTEGELSPNYTNAQAKFNLTYNRILNSLKIYNSSLNKE